jgi:putative nucleotidyltransferase with HDIG domain
MLSLVDEDTLSSTLSFRVGELVADSRRSGNRSSESRVTLPRHFLALLPVSVLATLAVIAGPVVVVAMLVPQHDLLWEALAVVLAVVGSLAIAAVGARLWMRWPRSREMIFAELMLWGWVRRFCAERRLARTRDLFESARESGSTVSIELLTELSDLHQQVDPYVHGHSRRVASYAGRIAREMHLPPDEIASVETAALVHDIGKIYTPQEILHKPSRLTDREFAIVKLHARDGAEIVADAGDPQITEIVRHHHERLDGNGYPDGIAGAEIPLGSRIIAVADTFDAITSLRPYRPPRSHREAIDILRTEAGMQLDATVVSAFLACYAARRPIARSAFAGAVSEQLISAIKASSATLTAGSIAQTLPALGVAGLLAASPALHHEGKVAGRHEVTAAVARLQPGSIPQGSAPVNADNAETVSRTGEPVGGRDPRVRVDPPSASTTSPGTSPVPSTSEPRPALASPGSSPSPSRPGSEPPKSTPATPVSSPVGTSPPVGGKPSQPMLPTRPAEPPVEVHSTPPVTVSVPETPVTIPVPGAPAASTPPVTVSVPGVHATISVPSVTTPAVNSLITGVANATSGVGS